MMRHLGSLALCLILGPVVYGLIGVGNGQWVQSTNETGADKYGAITVAVLAALGAGGLYALLVLLRLSPVGPMLAGLAFLGVGLWSMFALKNFTDVVPDRLFGQTIRVAGPVNLVLATPLLLTLFSPRRWRRWVGAPATVAPAPGYSPPPVSPYGAPSYGAEPSSPAGSYAAPGSPVGYQPPSWGNDDPESTRRL